MEGIINLVYASSTRHLNLLSSFQQIWYLKQNQVQFLLVCCFDEARHNHRFSKAPDSYHLLYIHFLHLECQFFLFFPGHLAQHTLTLSVDPEMCCFTLHCSFVTLTPPSPSIPYPLLSYSARKFLASNLASLCSTACFTFDQPSNASPIYETSAFLDSFSNSTHFLYCWHPSLSPE